MKQLVLACCLLFYRVLIQLPRCDLSRCCDPCPELNTGSEPAVFRVQTLSQTKKPICLVSQVRQRGVFQYPFCKT